LKKQYITANQLLEDSYRLALDIVESDFRPTFLLAIWRGGTPIGIAIQEVMRVCGIELDHIAIRTSSYSGIDKRSKKVVVSGLEYVVSSLTANDRVLIVDDVHDSGLSVAELIKQIGEHCGAQTPTDIRLATIYFKPARSLVGTRPEYYLHETDDWLVFPHELEGLSHQELCNEKPGLGEIKNKLLKNMTQEKSS